jgi:uncharacterized membrane protein YgcG
MTVEPTPEAGVRKRGPMPNLPSPFQHVASLVDGFFKRLAIRRFLTQLPRWLFDDYGHKGPFSGAQVEASLRRRAASTLKYKAYAQALFCDRDGSPPLKTAVGPSERSAARMELAERYFGGDINFSVDDVSRLAEHNGATSGEGQTGHGGGHHGAGADFGGGGHH